MRTPPAQVCTLLMLFLLFLVFVALFILIVNCINTQIRLFCLGENSFSISNCKRDKWKHMKKEESSILIKEMFLTVHFILVIHTSLPTFQNLDDIIILATVDGHR